LKYRQSLKSRDLADNQTSNVAILGAGNGGLAATVDLTIRGFSVGLWSRRIETLRPIQNRGGIEYSGVFGEGFIEPTLVTKDLGEVLFEAELVIIMLPTSAHFEIGESLAPFLTKEQTVLLAPGHTLTILPAALHAGGVISPEFCEVGTLPYICRKDEYAHVKISKCSDYLPFAAFPINRTDEMFSLVQKVFPKIHALASPLGTVFTYMNAIHHPPATICNAGRIENTDGDFFHYFEGITPSVGHLIDYFDTERRAVAMALGVETKTFVDHFYKMGYTTDEARETGLAYEAFHQSVPDRFIKAPKSLDHRFLDEDIPYGLVLLSELGSLAGIKTPSIDAMIHLAEVCTGKPYSIEGLTLERLGLKDKNVDDLNHILNNGF
jgi:opine dehydrogenase